MRYPRVCYQVNRGTKTNLRLKILTALLLNIMDYPSTIASCEPQGMMMTGHNLEEPVHGSQSETFNQ